MPWCLQISNSAYMVNTPAPRTKDSWFVCLSVSIYYHFAVIGGWRGDVIFHGNENVSSCVCLSVCLCISDAIAGNNRLNGTTPLNPVRSGGRKLVCKNIWDSKKDLKMNDSKKEMVRYHTFQATIWISNRSIWLQYNNKMIILQKFSQRTIVKPKSVLSWHVQNVSAFLKLLMGG